jgi:hypothetical protein
MLINSEYFYNPRNKKASENDLLDEEPEELMKKVEISTTKRKRRTRIEIVIKEPSMKFSNIAYLTFDFICNFLNICLIYYLINEFERNYLVVSCYISLLGVFMLRVLFIVSEMKNDYEFLFGYLISFFLALRLLTMAVQYNALLYTISCIYMFLLIMQYCLTDRRKFIVTALLMFHLFSACLYITSLFLFVMMVLIVCLPIMLRNNKKMSCSTIAMFIPVVVIVSFQIYGLKTIFLMFYEFEDYLKESGIDMFGFVQRVVHGYKLYELYAIQYIFENLNRIFNN